MYKIILTDCDGVLLDWDLAFEQWMLNQGYPKHVKDTYDTGIAYQIERSDQRRLVKTFNESAWVGFMEPFRDAVNGVQRLANNGYKFHCITSMTVEPKATELRKYNLERVFGKDIFTEYVFLNIGKDKDEALAPYEGTEYYWLEDKPKNAECGLQFGLKPILIEHEHNKNYKNENIMLLKNWEEIVDRILNG